MSAGSPGRATVRVARPGTAFAAALGTAGAATLEARLARRVQAPRLGLLGPRSEVLGPRRDARLRRGAA